MTSVNDFVLQKGLFRLAIPPFCHPLGSKVENLHTLEILQCV
jgi:hypothetical protein